MPAADKIRDQQVALGVDIGRDVMRDLAGVVADAGAAIEGRRPEPDRAPGLAALQRLPEAHVVAAVGAVPDRLLEGKVLLASVVEERADRRVAIRAGRRARCRRSRCWSSASLRSAGYQPAAASARIASSFAADQPDIHRIAGNAVGGHRHHRPAGQPRLVLVVRPDARQARCRPPRNRDLLKR